MFAIYVLYIQVCTGVPALHVFYGETSFIHGVAMAAGGGTRAMSGAAHGATGKEAEISIRGTISVRNPGIRG